MYNPRIRAALLGVLAMALLHGSALAQSSTLDQAGEPAAAARTGLITPADIKAWNTIRQNVLSSDGRWFAYVVSPNEGDATVVYRGTARGAPETRVNVGDGGGSIAISGDAKWLGYIVAPPRPPARGADTARTGDTLPADSARTPALTANKFVLVDLATGEKKEFERIRRFGFNADRPGWVALTGYGTADTPRQTGGAPAGPTTGAPAPAAAAGGAAPLLLYNLATAELFNMGIIGEYAFDDSGEWLAYTMQTPDRVGNGIQLRNMRTNVARSIESERLIYRHLAWIDSSRTLSAMRARIDEGARDTVFSIAAYLRIGPNGPAQRLVFDPATTPSFPEGWKLASERAPRFSRDMSAVFFGIREASRSPSRGPSAAAGAPGMGGSINQPRTTGSDSLPSLILWHARDARLQSQQMVQEQAERAFNYVSSYHFANNTFVRLADDELRNITITAGDRYAYGIDTRPYELRASYSGRNFQDIYAIDLATGARRLLMREKPAGAMNSSPDGRRVLYWGRDGNWWTLDLASGDTVNITRGAPVSFVNDQSDHNNLFPPPRQSFGWSRDGQYIVLSDGWDIWRVAARAGGSAVNLTGDGRATQTRYQRLYPFPQGRVVTPQPGIDLTRPLWFATYGEWTKQEGLARIDVSRPGAQRLFVEPARFNITKARDAAVYIYTRQTFTEYPNYHVFNAGFSGGYQITDVNPQMKDLAWSSGTRLIEYTTDKGIRLQGALYLPANYEPGRKYPLLVTIYEKRSQNLNGFVSPSETRTPDPTLYTNRGFAVLDPDIVYHVNDPGMSAVWAVVPAVKAAIATGIVDATNIGLWGHSWGGYQTAFLVTQTNMFKAAVAGAPLTDMISMYSSVYWNTGGANQAIFESSQGRFRGNFIDHYDAYIRNSPAFHAHKQTTPLIILHNEKDGAVDFNQGITHFNTLRQLGKEVILLQYVGENHGLSRPVNQRDYAGRMTEWFDHHLRGTPAPEWIRNGIPRIRLEEHLRERLRVVTPPAVTSSGGH
ncbi:MAG TPA: prolyl oligopeptidase family serine peptidase [Longimicrobiales bacterium]|nr:prolyl oligopeptidase family serine peptidase [Longimicrobiales bacterium]